MMRHRANSGFTLLEVIVSIAILAILISMFLSAFYSGAVNVIYTGQKSSELMDLQTIVDDLNQLPVVAPSYTINRTDIVYYLGTTKSYCEITNLNDITSMVAGEAVNFFVSGLDSVAGANGYHVTFVKFIDSGKRYARLSTFILEGGN